MTNEVQRQDLLQAVKTLALLARQNYPLQEAVDHLKPDANRWLEVGQRMNEGDNAAQALRRYPNIFSPFFATMFEVAERSHNAPKILESLSYWLETSETVRRKVRELLYYPLLLSAFLLMELGLLLFLAVPQIVMPLINIQQSPFAQSYPVFRLLGLLCLFLAAITLFSGWRIERILPLAYRFAAFRRITERADQALWARAVSALLQGGIPLPEALDRCLDLVWSRSLREQLRPLSNRLKEGDSLSRALAETRDLDPQLLWAVTAGENHEDLAATLLYAAGRLEHGLEEQCQTFLALIQPVAVILVGAATALVLISFWWSFYHYSWSLGLQL